MSVFTMSASVGSFDSGCEASESDVSLDTDSQSHNSFHNLEKVDSNLTCCGSSTLSDLSSTSMESFHWSQQHARAIVPIPSSKTHNEFHYTTVTPICYRNTGEGNCSTDSSKRSHSFHSGNYGLGKKGTANREENTTNISNNDNDYETRGPRGCANNSRAQYSVGRTNFDAVVMPCCDEPQQKFYFEQNRFPPGCLDIVLNGNDKYIESDTCSDIYRESGCESEDTVTQWPFRYTTVDSGTGDPCSRSWCSLVSFDGCEGLEEILSARSVPVDCFEDGLMHDDVRLLPVSVSLQSLSSSVGVEVRCAERIFCVDTTLRNSDDESREDEAMVDMKISAKNCSCSEDDESHYEVGLINNYISCSEDRCIDEQHRVMPSFGTCGKVGGTTPDGKRWVREQEQRACWESEVSGTFDERKTDERMSKYNLTSAQTNKRQQRAKAPLYDQETDTTGGKSRQKILEQTTNSGQNQAGRKIGAYIAPSKSVTKAASKRSRTGQSRTGYSSSKTSIGMSSSFEDAMTDSEQQPESDNRNPQNSASRVAEKKVQRNFVSLETAGNKSKSFIRPTSKAISEPAGIGKIRSSTKRSFRVEKKQLKGTSPMASYHEPHEAAEESALVLTAPEPIAEQSIVQAAASYHQPDLVAMASSVPNAPIHYDPTSVTILAAGEFFSRHFRHIPVLYPIRAIVSYEDDHGLHKNKTTRSIAKKYNRAKTKSNPAFVERVKLVPSVRSSRAAVPQSTEELSQPLSLGSIKYLDTTIEESEQLARIPPTEVDHAPSKSQSVLGYVERVTQPRVVSLEEIDQEESTSTRKQSVSFADMNPAFEDLLSIYPSFLLRSTPIEEDELYIIPSGPIPNLPALVEDTTLSPSELLARVAAASDRDLMQASLRPCHRSDSIGTSVTQVVSRWRKHYMDNDPCFPGQDGTNTWVRSLNAKSIQFNEDASCPTGLTDCTAVETNKTIYYQNPSCVEPTGSQLTSSSYSSDSEFIDARLSFRRSTDSTPTVPTVSPACYCGRPHNTSPASTSGYRRRRVSSADRSVDAMMGVISSSIARRLDEGDRSESNFLLRGDSVRGGSRIQRETDGLEMSYVEALLASIRSTTKEFMQSIVANNAVPRQQQQQQQQQKFQQHQQRQQQMQRQQQLQQQQDLSESVLTDYPSSRQYFYS